MLNNEGVMKPCYDEHTKLIRLLTTISVWCVLYFPLKTHLAVMQIKHKRVDAYNNMCGYKKLEKILFFSDRS